jgi:D-alanyl-D-alanine carboxypeptidase
MSRRLHPPRSVTLLIAALALSSAATSSAPVVQAQSAVKAAAPRSSARSRSSASRTTKTPVRRVSRRAAPGLVATTPIGDSALASDLAGLLISRARQGAWGVIVTSITRGDTLFRYNADLSSCRHRPQLFTTALAFERLGTHYQFTTDAARRQYRARRDSAGLTRSPWWRRSVTSGTLPGGTPEAPMAALAQLVATRASGALRERDRRCDRVREP